MDDRNPIAALLHDLEQPAPTLPDLAGDAPEDTEHQRRRGLVKLPSVLGDSDPELTPDEALAVAWDAMQEYVMTPSPTHILLIALPPGVGKTTLGVKLAEQQANFWGGGILYAGARHDMWGTLMEKADRPAYWQHWQPHTEGDPETGQGQTCRYARQFRVWVERGYEGIEFCKKPQVCGWDYINQMCPWHRQKHQRKPITFIQHFDVALKHPFMDTTRLLIGDEMPIGAMLNPWRIAPRDIVPSDVREFGLDDAPDTDLIELLQTLRNLVDQKPPMPQGSRIPAVAWEGVELLRKLGGVNHVAQVGADHPQMDATYQLLPPKIRGPEAVESIPSGHVPLLIDILRREADEALHGREYICRVRVDREGLVLLRCHHPSVLPYHVIWLDATANATLYEKMFRRPVQVVAPRVKMVGKVYQVWASLNNKSDVIGTKAQPKKRDELQQQVDRIIQSHGYARPAVITYKDFQSTFSYDGGYFHNVRGTNRFESHDALIVVGTPQASIPSLQDQGAMLHHERMRPFETTWRDRVVRYRGHDYGYAVSGFWHDDDLQALLYQSREAELVQVAHRVRPVRRDVDIWLLTNLPLVDLPPTKLISLHELFGAPKGVGPYQWPEVMRMLDTAGEQGVSSGDIADLFGVPTRTAGRWYEVLRRQPGVREIARNTPGRGRPIKACVKDNQVEFTPCLY